MGEFKQGIHVVYEMGSVAQLYIDQIEFNNGEANGDLCGDNFMTEVRPEITAEFDDASHRVIIIIYDFGLLITLQNDKIFKP